MEPNVDHRHLVSVTEHNLLNKPNRPCEVREERNNKK